MRVLRSPDARCVGFLTLFSVLFYYPLTLLGRGVVDYDAFVYFMPQRAYLGQAIRDGRFPLWNPDLFLGVPFLANPQTAVLYPPSWLFALGPVMPVYTIQLVLHAGLAAVGMYALARLGFSARPIAALVGGMAFGFGGFTVGQTGHLNQLSAGAWLPIMLALFERAIQTRSPGWAAASGLALAAQVLAGHPQDTYMSAIAGVAYALARAPWRSPRGLVWTATAGAIVGLVGGLVAAPQLLASLELAPFSIRGAGVRWEDAVAASLPSYLVPRSLFPPYWLDVASTEYLGYVGVIPLTLAFLAVVVVRHRLVWAGAFVCLLALFLAPGENNGNYWLFFAWVPGFDTFRVPARWLFLWMFGASLLSAAGAEWLLAGRGPRLRDPWTLLRAALMALVLTAGLAWQQQNGEVFPRLRTPAVYLGLATLALGIGALPRLGRRRLAGFALAGLAAAELWAVADWAPIRQAPPIDSLAQPPATAGALQALLGPTDRLLSVAQPNYVPSDEGAVRGRLTGISESASTAYLIARKWRETLAPNMPLQYGLRSADGYDGGVLPLQRFIDFSMLLMPPDRVRPDGVLQSRLTEPPEPRLLDLLGVSYVLANRGVQLPASEVRPVGDLDLLRRLDPAPFAFLAFRAQAWSDEEAAAQLAAPTYDPRGGVLLDAATLPTEVSGARASVGSDPSVVAAERHRYSVNLAEPAYLVEREAWYPGWRARVDGVEAPVIRADLLYRAVYVPAGVHEVELRFEPAWLRRGAVLALAGMAMAAACATWPSWSPRVRRRIMAGRGHR